VGVLAGVGSCDCDVCRPEVARSARAGRCVERFGGEVITTAKLGLGLCDLSRGLSTRSTATLFGVGILDLTFDNDFKWVGGGPARLKPARTGVELGTCFNIVISWSSSLIAIGSGEEAGERARGVFCVRLSRTLPFPGTVFGEGATLDAGCGLDALLSRCIWARRSARVVTVAGAGLGFPGAIALGTRAAIFARFCSTLSCASRNCEPFRPRGSESRLRLLDIWGGHRLNGELMDSGGVDVGRDFSSGFGDGERRKMDV
jgi:hypothetical protein